MAIDLLNDKLIKSAKATCKTNGDGKLTTATYSDGGGMHLEVTPDGAKRWRFRYRFDGKPKLVSLGVYPEITLYKAREKRNKARTDIANSIDPFPSKTKDAAETVIYATSENWNELFSKYKNLIANKKNDTKLEQKLFNTNTTFKQWSEWYMLKIADDVTETHLTRSLKGWKKDVYPVIGDLPMNDIKARDVISILNTMATRGVKSSAKKTFSSISRVFQVALANFPDLIERNPANDVSLKDVVGKASKAHYPLITEQNELGLLLNAIDAYTGYISTKLALKLISHTFVRPFNIRHAEWSEINLNTKQWIIPASKMKTRKELIVPLSEQAINIILDAKENCGDSKLLFPSPRSINTELSDSALVGGLRRLGYSKDEIVAHSFRGIFSTIAHEKAIYKHDVIETQLAHSIGSSVSQAYNRAEHLEARTEMMQWYSNLLQSYQDGVKR